MKVLCIADCHDGKWLYIHGQEYEIDPKNPDEMKNSCIVHMQAGAGEALKTLQPCRKRSGPRSPEAERRGKTNGQPNRKTAQTISPTWRFRCLIRGEVGRQRNQATTSVQYRGFAEGHLPRVSGPDRPPRERRSRVERGAFKARRVSRDSLR